jgi:hypothetical protein
MDSPFTRRDALKGMVSTGAAALIKPPSTLAHSSPILISSRPVEVTLTSITAQTVRITVQAIQEGKTLPLPMPKIRILAGLNVRCGLMVTAVLSPVIQRVLRKVPPLPLFSSKYSKQVG